MRVPTVGNFQNSTHDEEKRKEALTGREIHQSAWFPGKACVYYHS
jgi:hypothetical protein